MKNLFVIFALLVPSILFSQYNYEKPDLNKIDVKDYKNFPLKERSEKYEIHYDSRNEFYAGLSLVCISGLSFYFNTIGDGPYKVMGYTYSGLAAVKFISAAKWRKKENEWVRNRSH